MSNLSSTTDAARCLAVSSRTIQRIASNYSIGRKIGRVIIFTEADISALREKIRGKSGNPNFITGNYFGKPPKKTKKKEAKPIDA